MSGFQQDMCGTGVAPGTAASIAGSLQLSQTATGSNQTTAFAITSSTTEFTTVAASTGAILPVLRVTANDALYIVNNGANTLSVYPPVGFKIGTGATNAAVSIAAGKAGEFVARGDGNYFANISA